MAELQPAHFTQNACHTAQGDRRVFSSLVCSEGVHTPGAGDLLVTGGASGLSVDVAGGSAFIDGTNVAGQGMYHVWNDAPVNVVLEASDPTDPRIDLIVARVYDSVYAGAADEWQIESVTGTPSPSPTAPALPESSLLLAEVEVDPGATDTTGITITDERVSYQLCRENSPEQGLIDIITYTADSVFEKALYEGISMVRVRVVGGGAAGGGSVQVNAGECSVGGGGGGGAYAESYVFADALASTEDITVGAGGTGAVGAIGAAGEQSSFGSHVVSNGGGGGQVQTTGSNPDFERGGNGGSAPAGQITSNGSPGGASTRVNGNSGVTGAGAPGPYGGGGREVNFDGAGGDANAPGAGGGGARSTNGNNGFQGGNGGGGLVIVEVYS